MTDRLTLLSKIYVPRSMGADELLNSNDNGSNDTDPEITIGVRYVADKYFPILADETVQHMIPVSADIMQEVVADKLWCTWRLERDVFKIQDVMNARYFERGSVWMELETALVHVKTTPMHGVKTYTDLITLVRLAEG